MWTIAGGIILGGIGLFFIAAIFWVWAEEGFPGGACLGTVIAWVVGLTVFAILGFLLWAFVLEDLQLSADDWWALAIFGVVWALISARNRRQSDRAIQQGIEAAKSKTSATPPREGPPA